MENSMTQANENRNQPLRTENQLSTDEQISGVLEIIKKHWPQFVIYSPGDAELWNSATTYTPGDIVEFKGYAFKSITGKPSFAPMNKDDEVNSNWSFHASPNKHIIEALILYFFDNPEFEKIEWIKNPSLKKGFRFSGNVGTGKSLTLRIFSELSRGIPQFNKKRFGIFKCREVVRDFKTEPYTIDRHGARSYRKEWNQDQPIPITKAFDGFGEEIQRGPVVIYGEKTNVMFEIMLDRYDEMLSAGMITHITTNLTLDGIEKHYSTMLKDRVRQMFNNVIFRGPSFRK